MRRWPRSEATGSTCWSTTPATLSVACSSARDLSAYYELLQVNVAALVHLTYRLLPPMLARGHGKIVNNATSPVTRSFPGAAVYSASKSAVVGFSEALRRELEETPVSVLHLVTPGVETDMLEQVRDDYEPYVKDTSRLDGVEPRDWAEKIVKAIEDDDDVLNPSGAERLAKLASRGPQACWTSRWAERSIAEPPPHE